MLLLLVSALVAAEAAAAAAAGVFAAAALVAKQAAAAAALLDQLRSEGTRSATSKTPSRHPDPPRYCCTKLGGSMVEPRPRVNGMSRP